MIECYIWMLNFRNVYIEDRDEYNILKFSNEIYASCIVIQ